MELTLKHVTCGYGTTPILKDVSLILRQGEIVCILGPNGIGKTTIFRSVLGFLKLLEGEVLLDGVPRDRMRARDFACSVTDVVVMGRAAHLRPFEAPGLEEYRIVDQVLNMLEISYLREKTYTQISGGERQMVLIARALAQNSGLLVMDEPTATRKAAVSWAV